ncbi:MAG TPA: peptide-methionine (S)-S-oxide reductase [Crocinitomicaceae bacterium]|nr:peptide-methionine (S)-S-oxide reductase [Flavobacteriales bacterium]HBW85222.1 peptide-methionine (S)-S-oxide reductase [Crocinitomicaceae bacterium]
MLRFLTGLFFFCSFSSKAQTTKESAYFASGCFWCVEAIFEAVKGVYYAESGYSGGTVKNPTYEQICIGKTGHAETVKVVYNPKEISYETLLRVFFNSHDPSTLNKQGPDEGTQYRSSIFYQTEEEKNKAQEYIKQLITQKKFSKVTTTLEPFIKFYKAEEYHQDFEKRNPDHPYVKAISIPRLMKFKKSSPSYIKKE